MTPMMTPETQSSPAKVTANCMTASTYVRHVGARPLLEVRQCCSWHCDRVRSLGRSGWLCANGPQN